MARNRIQEPIRLVLRQMPNHLNPEAAETAVLLGKGRSDSRLAGRRSKHEWTTTHRRYAFHTSSTCEATPPYHRTTLQIIWAKVSHTCSGNQRGRNNGPHDVQNQDERTHAYRSSVAPSLYVRICCSDHTKCSAHVATAAACANCPSRFLPAASTANLTQASNSES